MNKKTRLWIIIHIILTVMVLGQMLMIYSSTPELKWVAIVVAIVCVCIITIHIIRICKKSKQIENLKSVEQKQVFSKQIIVFDICMGIIILYFGITYNGPEYPFEKYNAADIKTMYISEAEDGEEYLLTDEEVTSVIALLQELNVRNKTDISGSFGAPFTQINFTYSENGLTWETIVLNSHYVMYDNDVYTTYSFDAIDYGHELIDRREEN